MRVSAVRAEAEANGIGFDALPPAGAGAGVVEFERDGAVWWRLPHDRLSA